jgi:dolichyl-diphosphooligosaccharide--protein glycosyltransferase
MNVRKMLNREKIVESLKGVTFRPKISHSSLIFGSLLFLILFLAFSVRLLPIRWGYYLSEFDPHYQYRLAKHMVDNGFFGPSSWIYWHDDKTWYPWGRDMGKSYPGLPATEALFYSILNALGIRIVLPSDLNPLSSDPVYNFCILFPVIMGTLTCLVMYFLGKDIGGKEMGLLSAFFLALSGSYISRTALGFSDDETVGIFGILLFILFFLRSIEPERSIRSNAMYGVAAGLSLGYIFASWGASRYALGMALLFVFVLLLLRRYTPRLLLSYSLTFGVSLFIAVNIPALGFGFLTEATTLVVFGLFLLLCLFEAARYIKTFRRKTIFVIGFLALFAAVFLALSWLGVIRPLGDKFMSVINPYERLFFPLIESVQEHRPSAWGSFYYDFGIGIFFIPVGLFFAAQNPTNRNLFLVIFGLTSVYFAGSMVRLSLLMAPAFCLLWALALTRLLRPFITVMKEAPIIPRRKIGFQAHVGKEFSGAFLIFMLLLLTFTFVLPTPKSMFPRVFDHAYAPVTIAAGSMPIQPSETVTDWFYALNWMRSNESVKVVASWWDYGYWITIVGNKTTLCDNGTINMTQIEKVAETFMSNEANATKILKQYDVTHVLIFITFQSDSTGNGGIDIGWGDESKWRWMARISEPLTNRSDTAYGNSTLGTDWFDSNGDGQRASDGSEDISNDLGKSTIMYKMMQYVKQDVSSSYGDSTAQFELQFKLVYTSTRDQRAHGNNGDYNGAYGVVGIFEVKY